MDTVPRAQYESVVQALHDLKGEIAVDASYAMRVRDLQEMLDVAVSVLEQIAETPHCRHAKINARAAVRILGTLGYRRHGVAAHPGGIQSPA